MENKSNTISATETANFQLIAIKVNKDKTIGQRKLTANKPYFFGSSHNCVGLFRLSHKIDSHFISL